MATLNGEHVELLVSHTETFGDSMLILVQNELVRARLRNEEIESELVRYKLLCVPVLSPSSLCLLTLSFCLVTLRRCTRTRTPTRIRPASPMRSAYSPAPSAGAASRPLPLCLTPHSRMSCSRICYLTLHVH
jgi:hypothetical protein